MTLKLIFLLIISIYLIFTIATEIVITNKITIIEGQGFIIHLKIPPNFGKLKTCWYKVQDEEKTIIDLNSNVPHERETGELITPYTNLICGIRVIHASINSTGKWMLEAENDRNQLVNQLTSLTITKSSPLEPNRIIVKSPGKSMISCSTFDLRRSCRISNQRNGIVHDKCEMQDMIRNKTTYKCSFLSWGSMFETHETITVQVDKFRGKTTEADIIENESYILMNCQFSNKIVNCRGEYPNKINQIYIRDGFSGERISAFDTDLANGKCVLELKKPIKDEEIGIWKILSNDNNILSGCLFYLPKNGTDKKELIQLELDKIPKQQTIEIVNSTEIDLTFICKSSFVVDYCYLRDPKNHLKIPSVYSFEMTRMLGQCHFEKVEKIPGEWICGMAGKDYDGEFIQKFKVVLLEKGGKAITKNVFRAAGQSVEMLCQSTEREPMNECGFIDPRGNVYLVSNEFNSTDKNRIHYFGDGLEYGDCGLKIDKLKDYEIGGWTCTIRTSVHQYSYKINVEEPSIDQTIANSIGIGISAASAVLLMGGLFYYRRRHIQNQTQEQVQVENPNEAEEEEENPNEIMTSRL